MTYRFGADVGAFTDAALQRGDRHISFPNVLSSPPNYDEAGGFEPPTVTDANVVPRARSVASSSRPAASISTRQSRCAKR